MSRLGEGLLSAYVAATRLGAAAGPLIVESRRRRGKEHPERWRERLGVTDAAVETPLPTVWVHAASVGETVAVLPLVARLAGIGVRVVLTTVTTTSAAVADTRLPAGVVHQFVPLDAVPFVDRFVTAWNPRLAVLVESEVWPVAIARLASAKVPLVVSNARMSDRSYRRWRRVPAIASAVFGRISLCLAQSADDAERFRALGAPQVLDIGNIKYDAPVPEADPEAAAALATAIGARSVFLAASTHPGEEAAVLDAFATVRAGRPDLLLVIAPRHPARGPELEADAVARGLVVARRAAGEVPGAGTDVYLADTVGELGTFYGLATVAFVGGSLVPVGGHNPVEPARLGVPVISGPEVFSFREAYGELQAAGGVAIVTDAETLAESVDALLADANLRETRAAAASRVVERHSGALERTFRLIEPLVSSLALGAHLDPDGARP